MSDPFPYIATIKHLYTGPTGTNILDATPKGCNGPAEPIGFVNVMDIAGNLVPVKRTWSGTFGDGNVSFSLPKEGECIHGSSKFMCVFCEKWYGVKRPTIEPSKQESSEKTGPSSNPPLSQNETSGMYSSLRPQSPSEHFSSVPDETKSDGPHTRLSRTLSFAHQR